MGPQLVAHLLMILLIVGGERRVFHSIREGARRTSMKRETLIWTLVMLLGAVGLIGRAVFSRAGHGRASTSGSCPWPTGQRDAVRTRPPTATTCGPSRRNPGQTAFSFSLQRTVGLWLAAFFTLAIFSFLYRDNPFYKVAESVLVGVSAAYWMVVGFWDVIVPNLFASIWPALVQAMGHARPERSGGRSATSSYVVPLVLGIMLLWRLAPKGAWIARWPLAFIVGTTAGLRLIGFLHGDFLAQIRNTILPLVVFSEGPSISGDRSATSSSSSACSRCLMYFFFSFEHKGVVGKAARVGIWLLMITFGAAFGYTVMGRIALRRTARVPARRLAVADRPDRQARVGNRAVRADWGQPVTSNQLQIYVVLLDGVVRVCTEAREELGDDRRPCPARRGATRCATSPRRR